MASGTTTVPPTSTRILEAATVEFFDRGYHGSSVKDVSDAAGVRSATLYYHFPNKEAMLVEIMTTTLVELTRAVRAAIADAPDPIEALRAAVMLHIRFHVERYREVFICDAELRALSPDARAEIVGLRDAYEDVYRTILRSGRDRGLLVVPQVELVTRSLLASCSGVAFWYRPDGALSLDEVATVYVELFLRALQAPAP